MRIFKVTIFLVFCSLISQAQVVSSGGGTGDWNDPNSWSPAGVPDETSGTITIQGFHTITVSDAQSADELTVDGDGTLNITSGGELTIVDGTGDDLTVAAADFITTFSDGILNIQSGGELINQGQVSTPELTFTVESGGQYTHAQNGGSIPTVTWNSGSAVELQEIVNTLPSGISQSFHDFNYNSTTQTAGILYLNGLTTLSGDLNIVNSNARFIAVSSVAATLTVAGNVTIQNSSKLYLSPTSNVTLDIEGDLTVDSNQGGFAILFTATGSCTIDVAGNFVKNNGSGTINFAASSGSGTLNVGGDFTVNAGTLTESSTGSGNVNFTGSSLQTYTNSGTISNTINFTLNTSSIVDLGSNSITGAGTFTTSNLSELRVGSTAASGAIQTGTTAGNIRVSGTRTYNSGSTIVYNGSSAQFMGNGHPNNVNTTINNSNGVTLASGVTIGGALTLSSGNLTLGSNAIILQGSFSGSGSLAVTSASSLTFSGIGTIGTLPFVSSTPTIGTLTIDRSGELGVLEDNLNITNTLNLTQGDLDIRDFTLNLSGSFTGTGNIRSNSTSVINITGTGAFGTLQFDPSFNTIGSITYNRSSGAFTLSGTVTIDQSLVLTNGTFNNSASLFMANGATLTKNSNATFSGDSPETSGADTYGVTYVNAGQTTGSEIPDELTTDALGELTVNTAGAVVLDQNLQVNGNVNLNSGSLSIGSNQLTVTGNWVRNSGSMASYNGLVIFDGASLINGTNTATFVNVEVAGGASITLPAGNVNINGNLQIDPSATFVANGGTVILGTTSSQNLATGGATFNNIAVNKSSGTVTIASQLNLQGRMTFSGSSSATVASSGNLVILSSSDGTSGNGSIGVVPSGASITGNIIVQRFLSGEGRIYRYLSSPVGGANFEQWRDDFPITGTFSDPSTGSGIVSSSPSLFRYNESLTGVADDGWEAHPTSGTLASHTIEVGRGYAAFIREGSASTTVDVTGTVNLANISNISLGVTYNDSGNGPTNEGWNLVGNPFPSSIDWDNVLSGTGGVRTNVDQGIHVRDNGAGGVYRTWDGSVGDLDNGLIATGQAFWVRANANSPVLSLNEQAKSTSTASFYRVESASAPEIIQISLTDENITDNTFISFDNNTILGYDTKDTPNLSNLSFDITTFGQDSIDLAINYIGGFNCEANLGINISDLPTGSFTIEFSQLETLSSGREIFLIDNFTESEINVKTTTSYDFTVDDTNVNTYGKGRFELHFSRDIIVSDLVLVSDELVCEDEMTNLIIENSQDDINYTVYINGEESGYNAMGTGEDLILEIASIDLASGNNNIIVYGEITGCTTKAIGDEQMIFKKTINEMVEFEVQEQVCQDENVVLTVLNSENEVTYDLYLNNELALSKIGNGGELMFDISSELNTGENSINFVASLEGCSSQNLEQEAVVTKTLVEPEISITDNTLQSNYETGNQWYFDGSILQGENSSILVPEESGFYELEVTINGCSSTIGVDFFIEEVTGIVSNEGQENKLYPNPVSEFLTVESINTIELVEIFDHVGNKVFLSEPNAKIFNFNSRYLSQGIYFIRISSKDKVELQRFIKK